jgi:hypothetical protein
MYIIVDSVVCHLFQIYGREILGAKIGKTKFLFMSIDIDSHFMKTLDEDELKTAYLEILVLKHEDGSETELDIDYWNKAIEADLIGKEIEFTTKKYKGDNIAYPIVENPLWDKELNFYLQHDDEPTLRKFKIYLEQHYDLVKKLH